MSWTEAGDVCWAVSPGGAVVHLQRALGWSEVHQATPYFIHTGGFAGDPSFWECMEVQPVDEFCGTGGLSKIMENSSCKRRWIVSIQLTL